MTTTASTRLARLLGLVPYLIENPGADLHRTAAVFGVTVAELVDDLELLFVTGRPGRMPDDLIEASWEDGRIHLGNADEVSVPVRLTRDESTSLLVALDYLASLDPDRQAAIASTRDKIRTAAGLQDERPSIDVGVPELDRELAAEIRGAAAAGTGLDIRYYVPSRDELTARTVTPRSLRLTGQWYMDAYCHTSGGERSFAVDNIRSAAPATAPAAPPAPTGEADAGSGAGAGPDESGTAVTLALAPAAAWLADELDPLDRAHDTHGPGTVTMTLRVLSDTWLTRLLLQHGRHVLAVSPPEAADGAISAIASTAPGADDSHVGRD